MAKKVTAVNPMTLPMWTLEVAAQLYGVSVQTLRKKVVAGVIEGKKQGRWYVTKEAMDAAYGVKG